MIISTVRSPRVRHVAEHAEHFVGLVGREHRGRLVEEQELVLQVELLADFQLSASRRRPATTPARRSADERHGADEVAETLRLLLPVDDRRHVGARQHHVLGTVMFGTSVKCW